MGIYETKQGDSWDYIAFKLYGSEKYMKLLIEANWKYLDVLRFSAGVILNVPDLPEDAEDYVPFWRSDSDENEEPYSSLEELDNE